MATKYQEKPARKVSGAHVVPATSTPLPDMADTQSRFDKLANEWENETRNISSPKTIVQHPTIRRIIGMGESVVPLILRRMKHHPWFWFGPLMELTRETIDPVTPTMRGDMQQMTEAWLKWGT
jgi:hypothetical protein